MHLLVRSSDSDISRLVNKHNYSTKPISPFNDSCPQGRKFLICGFTLRKLIFYVSLRVLVFRQQFPHFVIKPFNNMNAAGNSRHLVLIFVLLLLFQNRNHFKHFYVSFLAVLVWWILDDSRWFYLIFDFFLYSRKR